MDKEDSKNKTYIDWLLNLPYSQKTKDNKSLKSIEKKLNESHFGLENVKREIIEHIAYAMHSKNEKISPICLIGPPGVGKTSIAKAIAKALGRKFEKISFANFNDPEAFKGHSRTYTGSQPGVLIKVMKIAGVINPVILLDEIEKSAKYRGSITDSLLEVLDPEQNETFTDIYIEEYYDVSKVFFITTANYEEKISAPLLDRLNIIRLDAYSLQEKIAILKNYTIKELMNEAKLSKDHLVFQTKAIEYIINKYTDESGIREAKRQVQRIIEKVVYKLIKYKKHFRKEIININRVKKYLGDEIYNNWKFLKPNSFGEVLWLTLNIDAKPSILLIETSFSEGSGDIYITGGGDNSFIKESGVIALNYIKTKIKDFDLDADFLAICDLYINIIDGNLVAKDESVGIVLISAILSSLKKIVIPSNVILLGKISLHGHIYAVNKVEEKIVAASEKGIKVIYLPKENEKALEKIASEFKKGIKFYLVENYIEIYNSLFNAKN